MREILSVFLKIGALGFGGPLATMAMMEQECAQKRGWLTSERFGQVLALVKLMPGATATQLAIFLATMRGGRWAGLLAGCLFLLPAFLLVLVIGIFYGELAHFPMVRRFLTGMQIAALIVIFESVLRLGKPFRSSARAGLLVVVTALLTIFRPGLEPLIILSFGLLGVFGSKRFMNSIAVLPSLFSTSFKAGALVFGTGLAVVPMLEADVVHRFHWLSSSEFLDALAVGQITPGPVVITATFIGYRVDGVLGALVATGGIFLPSFILGLFVLPMFEARLSGNPKLKDFAAWAVPAVVGGVCGSLLRLASGVILGPHEVLLTLLIALLAFRFRAPTWATIPAGGALFLLLHQVPITF